MPDRHPTACRKIPRRISAESGSAKLSVLLPYLNEQDVIAANARETVRILKELGIAYEVVLIDDGSTDESYARLSKEFAGRKDVVLVRNLQNFGKGWALKTGFEYSTGDYVLFLDSDLELSPYHIPNFFRVMDETGADVVIGSKIHEDSLLDYPPIRRLYSKTFYTITRILFGLPVMDTQTGIKLFTREALEKSLPKLIVKKFAFDLELLLLLVKNGMKIEPAPIELKFSRGKFGRIKLKSVVNMFVDTLAIFYRDKFLRFYERSLGANVRYRYTFVLFTNLCDAYEKESLERFLNVSDPDYNAILVGRENFGVKDKRLTFVKSGEWSYTRRLKLAKASGKLTGDFVVLSTLNSYPDNRYLMPAGRVLSMEGVWAAGGYLVLRKAHTRFEFVSNSVIRSFFLNTSLHYRYHAVNMKDVPELLLDGMIVKREAVDALDFEAVSGMKLEYALSRQVRGMGGRIVYSPDLMLYSHFPDSLGGLLKYIGRTTRSRAAHWKSSHFKGAAKLRDWKYGLSLLLLVLIASSVTLSIVLRNPWFMAPLGAYYFLLLLTRWLFFGLGRGTISFLTLALCQLYYGGSFLFALVSPVRRTE